MPVLANPPPARRRGALAPGRAVRNPLAPWGRGWALDDDLLLVQAVIRGEARAVRAFADRLGPVAGSVVHYYRGRGGLTPEDLCQQVFEKLAENDCRRLRTYRGEAGLETWLVTVCRRTALDCLRANRRHELAVSVPDGDDSGSLIDNLPGDGDTQAEAIVADLRAQLRRALALLSPAYREVLEFFYRDDLDYREIAARTGDTVSNVGVKLSRARAKLRRIVESEFPDLPLHLDGE